MVRSAQTYLSISSFELFGALYMYISGGSENLCTVQAVQNSVRKFTNFWAITYFIRKKWLDDFL